MTDQSQICARCRHFSIKGHQERAERGQGQCYGFIATESTYRDWNDPKCALFRPAAGEGPAREKWISKQAEKSR